MLIPERSLYTTAMVDTPLYELLTVPYIRTYSGLTCYAHRFHACPIPIEAYPSGISIQAESIITSVRYNSSIRSSGIQGKSNETTVVNLNQVRAKDYNNEKKIV